MGKMNNVNTTHPLVIVIKYPSESFDIMRCDPESEFSTPFMYLKLDPHTFS
jgi:hypothetical protein